MSLKTRDMWDNYYIKLKIINFNWSVYAVETETGILFVLLANIGDTCLKGALISLRVATEPFFCAHVYNYNAANNLLPSSILSFTTSNERSIFASLFSFWHLLELYVKNNGSLYHVVSIRSGDQVFYSKIKCGDDGATQYQEIMRNPSAIPAWELKSFYSDTKYNCNNRFIVMDVYKKYKSSGVYG